MTCELTQRFVHGYADGELDLVRTIEMEAHLKYCSACAQNLENQQKMRAALRGSLPAYAAPAVLRERIKSSLRTSNPAVILERKMKWPSLRVWQWAGAVTTLALFSLTGWQLTAHLRAPSNDERITAEVFSNARARVTAKVTSGHMVRVLSSWMVRSHRSTQQQSSPLRE